MTQLNASVLQLRLGLGLGLKFGYSSIDWDILYLLNTFLRYRQFKSVSDGHSPKLLYKSIVQPSLRLQRYLEFISVSRFLVSSMLWWCHHWWRWGRDAPSSAKFAQYEDAVCWCCAVLPLGWDALRVRYQVRRCGRNFAPGGNILREISSNIQARF